MKKLRKHMMVNYKDGESSVYDVITKPAQNAFKQEGGRMIEVRYSSLDRSLNPDFKNKLGMTLHNDGNGVILKTKEGTFRLSYLDLDMLQLGLTAMEEDLTSRNPMNQRAIFEVKKVK